MYADAFANVDVTFKADRGRQQLSWEAAYGFYEVLEQHDPDGENNAEVEAVIEEVADDINDAVETLLDGMAKQCEEHYDYITSEEGVWESAEGCGDFDDIFISHINRS
jgi:dGTP triphosphohydrolase